MHQVTQSKEESVVKVQQTWKYSKEQYELKNETVEKLIPLWQGQSMFYNINHLHYTEKTKRNVALEKIREGFE